MVTPKDGNRISKIDMYLNCAENFAYRSTCIKRKYGAVIVKNDVVISTGYNGSPRGFENCCDIGKCPRVEKDVGRILRTFKIKKNVEVTDNGKIII